MTDIRLEREFKASPDRLFDFVTQRTNVLQWFGYESFSFSDERMDLSKLGAWFVDMLSDEGNRFKISGQVTHVDRPKSVGFTWGWHDQDDNRGPESHVVFTVVETAAGARLIIDHRELDDGEVAANHEGGWTNALRRIGEALAV
ncbi:hypothetical protein NBRC116601_21700 [Cognatishimia sp. WU-CL00825]|uniref:SRPBCC family protein n=1 Tax=Cognatishimia sp. WU-CL00825 TaxID=3127658 RepID=UPI0031052EC9